MQRWDTRGNVFQSSENHKTIVMLTLSRGRKRNGKSREEDLERRFEKRGRSLVGKWPGRSDTWLTGLVGTYQVRKELLPFLLSGWQNAFEKMERKDGDKAHDKISSNKLEFPKHKREISNKPSEQMKMNSTSRLLNHLLVAVLVFGHFAQAVDISNGKGSQQVVPLDHLPAHYFNNFTINFDVMTPVNSLVLAIVMICVGPVLVLFGEKVFRPAMAALGFVVGAYIVNWVIYEVRWDDMDDWHISTAGEVLLMIAGGIVGALLFYFLYYLSVFLLGALVGLVLFNLAYQIALDELGSSYGLSPGWRTGLAIAIMLVFGLFAVAFHTYILIFATSFVGAYFIVGSIDFFCARAGVWNPSLSPFAGFFQSNPNNFTCSNSCIGLVVLWAVLFLFGSLFQLHHVHQKVKRQRDEQYVYNPTHIHQIITICTSNFCIYNLLYSFRSNVHYSQFQIETFCTLWQLLITDSFDDVSELTPAILPEGEPQGADYFVAFARSFSGLTTSWRLLGPSSLISV
eukprot:g12137.t1